MACDFRNDGHVPNRLELRMALQVHRGIYQRMVDDGDLLVTMTSWVCKSLYQFCCAFHRFSIFSTELWGPLGPSGVRYGCRGSGTGPRGQSPPTRTFVVLGSHCDDQWL